MKNNLGVKKIVSPKKAARAGLSLSAGFIALPFIKFKDASHYKIKSTRRF